MQDNTVKWGVRKLTKFQENSGLPVGFEYFSTNPNIPMGSLPLFGGEYSRKVYSDLWAWVQEQAGYLIEESEWQEKSAANGGNVPFYSKGNGTTTFRVPSLKCWVKGANGIEEVGSYLSAGLPNITGHMYTNWGWEYGDDTQKPQGAFQGTRYENIVDQEGTTEYRGWTGGTLSFNASKSNSIYGNSDTVQPKSIVGMWLVKAYGTVTNVGSTDVASIAQGLTELETNKLSLSGGTMAGTIKVLPHLTGFSGHNSIEIENEKGKEIQLAVKDNNLQYSFLSIHSTEDVTTPDGTTHNGGAIIAGLSNGTDLVFFEMNPKGKMVFNGFYLSINSIGDNYIRYDNGIQICWGYVERPATNAFITFPVPFLANNGYGLSANIDTTNWMAESFQLRGQISWLTWLAIGRWK